MTTERKSYIGNFMYSDVRYIHDIFIYTDDRVECTDEEGKLVLTHTANCEVKTPDGKIIGRWYLTDHRWSFETSEGKKFHYDWDLLESEMHVSKLFIEGKL